MSISHNEIYADSSQLNALRRDAKNGGNNALQNTAEQFEALFLQMMMKSMRQASATEGEGLFDNQSSRFYQEMFDQQIAMEMAKKRQVGISDFIVNQLGEANADKPVDDHGFKLDMERVRIGRPMASTAIQAFAPTDAIANESIKGFDSPQDFIEKLQPYAEKYAKELGVPPKVLLAQAALETGWGQHTSRYDNGISTHNLFNIKADSRWEGPKAVVATLEYEKGKPVREMATFRSYPNFEASFADYVEFIKSSPRYQKALQVAGDGDAYINELHQAGYATDPKYAQKVSGIMARDVMQNAQVSLQQTPESPII